MSDPLDLDALGQAGLVRSGEITPAELVGAAIERIERLNPSLNAVIHPLFEKARAQVADPDSIPVGPFTGVPFLVKDAVCHTSGDPYHLGMRFLKERHWTEQSDTYLARRFRQAGFVFVGKTNTPEMATSVTTEPLAYGPTHNPWDLARSPGGSSGGSAAAVASGMVAVAHGNDMGGSIRAPSAHCGLVGLKPTRARASLGPDFGDYWGVLTHEGVLTRSVRDTAAVIDAVAGLMPGDPYTAPPITSPLLDEVGVEPGPLRVGFRTVVPLLGTPAHEECIRAVERTADLLQDLGHHVEENSPPALDSIDLITGPFGQTACIAVARELDRWAERTGERVTESDVEPSNWMMAEMGRSASATQYLAAQEAMQRIARELCEWWASGFDLLVTPTVSRPAPELGLLAPDADPAVVMPLLIELTGFVAPWNMTGQPALSLPLHWTDEGIPVGVQLIAPFGREDLLIRTASQLERAQPWSGRRPRVHGFGS